MVKLEDIDINDISDDMLLEFANWTELSTERALAEHISDEPVCYLHFKRHSDIFSFINDWNKTQYAMKIFEWKIYPMKDTKPVLTKYETLLAGGKRLLRQLIKIVEQNWENVKIVRIGIKFDTRYFADKWSPLIQTKIDTTTKKAPPTISKKKKKT